MDEIDPRIANLIKTGHIGYGGAWYFVPKNEETAKICTKKEAEFLSALRALEMERAT